MIGKTSILRMDNGHSRCCWGPATNRCGLPVYLGEIPRGHFAIPIAIGLALGGLTFLVIGIALIVTVRPSYHIRIGSTSGEATLLTSKDKQYATSVVNAVNQAIIQRG